MNKTIHKVPFLRIVVALSVGILTGSFLQVNTYLLIGSMVVLVCLLLLIHFHYRMQFAIAFGIAVHVAFIAVGMFLHQYFNKKPEFHRQGKFVATVLDILQEKPKSYQSELKIHAIIDGDSVVQTEEIVLVWFEKDEKVKALIPGKTIAFDNVPEHINSSCNPFEFDYRKFMARKRIYRQVFLSSDKWIEIRQASPADLSIIAQQVRLHLLNVFSRQDWDNQAFSVISALVLGYRQGLDNETKHAFTSAGAVHLLAVSGLHVGILYMVLIFLFRFLNQLHSGKLMFVLLVILSLWAFAFITGLSPSVKRAAAMFTFIVVGQSLGKKVTVYNSLAASAFFLLLFNPNNLFDAGFQLSYSAVLGIVFLQPHIDKLINVRNIFLRYIWGLFAVSVAAQLATFPISTFYFHQFPTYFWLSNLVAVPIVTMLIPMGIVLLVLNWVSFLSTFFSGVIAFLLKLLIGYLKWIEQFPWSTADVYFTPGEMFLVLAVVGYIGLFIGYRRMVYLRNSLVFFLLYLILSLSSHVKGLNRREIIVYNYPRQYVTHLIDGKRNYIITEDTLDKSDPIQPIIKNTTQGLRLREPVYITCQGPFNDSVLCVNRGFIRFNNQSVVYLKENQTEKSISSSDIIIGNFSYLGTDNHLHRGKVFVSHYVHAEQCLFEAYNLREKGAFRRKW